MGKASKAIIFLNVIYPGTLQQPGGLNPLDLIPVITALGPLPEGTGASVSAVRLQTAVGPRGAGENHMGVRERCSKI